MGEPSDDDVCLLTNRHRLKFSIYSRATVGFTPHPQNQHNRPPVAIPCCSSRTLRLAPIHNLATSHGRPSMSGHPPQSPSHGIDGGSETDSQPGAAQHLLPGIHENHHTHSSDTSSDKHDPEMLQPTKPTPVPYRAVLALAASRVMEGIIWSSILPYINAFIRDIGVPKHQVGVWSAASVSACSCIS